MIRIAVCEDKGEDLAHLRGMLRQTGILCDITEYTSAEALLSDMETNRKHFDIFLLDIYLSGQNGVEAARRIRTANQDAIIIFLSVSEEFYRDAFNLYAFHYLIKPVSLADLTEVLMKAAAEISTPEETLEITFRRHNIILRQGDIMYISSSHHTLNFHMQDGTEYTCYGRLDELEARLSPELFVRCHKSFIVSLFYVSRLTQDGFYIDETLIPISRSYAASAKKSYHKRLFGIFQDN